MKTKPSQTVVPAVLAGEFARIIREWLTVEQLAEVVRLNAAAGAGSRICRSHDFCDANQAMIDALEFCGIVFDCTDPELETLVDAAWAIAKASGFSCKTLEQVARLAIEIYDRHEAGAEMDAGFDGGEWSGPAHGDMADEQVADLARANGFTLEQVTGEISVLQAADEGPYGRNE